MDGERSITVEWAERNGERVLVIACRRRWSWEALDRAAAAGQRKLDRATRPVDVVLDLSAHPLPPNGAIWHIRRIAEQSHPMCRRLIVVGASAPVRALVAVLTTAYGTVFRPGELLHAPDLAHLPPAKATP